MNGASSKGVGVSSSRQPQDQLSTWINCEVLESLLVCASVQSTEHARSPLPHSKRK